MDHRAAPGVAPEPGVRWGLVLIAVLVGTIALWRGLGWYFDPIRQTAPMRAVTTPDPPHAPGQSAPPLPAPTRAELALLSSVDSANQLKAAVTLLGRAITPDLMREVDAALARQSEPEVEARLVCVKCRFQGPETLEFLLARFPVERRELASTLKPDVACMLDALAARSLDAPERIAAALLPAAYATNGSTRAKVIRAYRTMDLPQIPAVLLTDASTPGAPYRREALAAAVALGAVRHNPDLVAQAVRDPFTRQQVREELVADPHANAARIVANVSAERSFEREYEQLAGEREAEMHDVSAALLELVLNPTEAEPKRTAAARQLALLQEVGPLHDLRELSPTLEPGQLKAAVDGTIHSLQVHQRTGTRPRMRTLPP